MRNFRILGFACSSSSAVADSENLISAKALSVAIVTLLGVVVVRATASVFVGDGRAVAVLVGDVVDDLDGGRLKM